ncbi:MAG: marine proteobacterial sortase target protein, partial [Ketobacteraceae bacterium]|nr:marine proteobacterial sortase target protein [Ketobacteraceae bacterium]
VRRYLLKTTESAAAPRDPRERSGFWDRVHQQDLWLAAVMLILMVVLQSRARADQPMMAQEHYASLADVGTGSLVVPSEAGYQSLLRLESAMALTVSGLVVQARVTQQFRNTSTDWVEATYVFPLPGDSAVHAMRMHIGERIIEGVIKERQQAQQLFVKAKQQGRQAGLLEQQRPNLFTTKVANIPPGEAIHVEFEYLQRLHYDDGEFSLRLPLTLTPRYIPGRPVGRLSANGWSFPTDQVPDAPLITPPQVSSLADAASHRVQVSVELNPGFDLAEVSAPFHDIRVDRQRHSYHIAPRQNPVMMNRDFVIRWRPVADQAPTAAVFLEDKPLAEQGMAKHALLMLMPPAQAFADVIPPRELLVIIDTSGSMSGASIAQAKAAVLLALERLRPSDRFNVMEFNSRHRLLFPFPQPAEYHHLQQARAFVQALAADGGTEIRGALEAAFAMPKDEGFLRQIVFITDGSVGNEHALLELIHRGLGNSRLYTVGIGSAPNEFFMRKAAEYGKGTYAMIGSQQQVQGEMSALFDRIEKPVMTDLQVSLPDAVAVEWFPQRIPDLYAGQPLVMHGRFEHWPEAITVSGRFSGQHWQQTFTLQSDSGELQQSPGVATLWAREKVQALEDESTRSGNRDWRRNEILGVGLAYGIVTRFTSFIAIARERVRDPEEPLHHRSVPNLMPAGSTQTPPTVGMPQTALGIHFQLLLGVISMLVALLIGRLKHGCNFSAIESSSKRSLAK